MLGNRCGRSRAQGEGGVLMMPHALGCRQDCRRETCRDADIDLPYRACSVSSKRGDGDPERGHRAVWEESHHGGPFPWWLD